LSIADSCIFRILLILTALVISASSPIIAGTTLEKVKHAGVLAPDFRR